MDKKPIDTLIEQRKSSFQVTLEFKLNRQMKRILFSSEINFFEEGKWLLGVTKLEAMTSISDTNNKNNSFSFTTPERWTAE